MDKDFKAQSLEAWERLKKLSDEERKKVLVNVQARMAMTGKWVRTQTIGEISLLDSTRGGWGAETLLTVVRQGRLSEVRRPCRICRLVPPSPRRQ